MKRKSRDAKNRKAKTKYYTIKKKLNVQMQNYLIKPGIVDNKNPQQEKLQSLQQCSSSMNVDGPGSNPESQSYGHNDHIHIQGNLFSNDSDNNVQNITHKEANVSSSNDHYLSEIFTVSQQHSNFSSLILLKIKLIMRRIYLKAMGQKKIMSHKLMMDKAVTLLTKTLLNTLHH